MSGTAASAGGWLRLLLICAALLAKSGTAISRESTAPPLTLLRNLTVAPERQTAAPAVATTHRMRLSVAILAGSRRSIESVRDASFLAGAILARCGIAIEAVAISVFDGPARFRYLSTPDSREFARAASLNRPAVFFVEDTRHRPAFDAEAFGLANSRTRPELANTVWITEAARDLPVVIAHELAHVLANSGAHSDDAGNLMREDTAPENTRLSAAQCGAIVENGTAGGLLLPVVPIQRGDER